jgi:aspartate/methionine/tyrosine aminotransferase
LALERAGWQHHRMTTMPRMEALAAGRLPAFALERYFGRWEFTARYNLCASDVRAMRLDELLALAEPTDRSAWERHELGYTHTLGSPGLREAIADTYDHVRPEDVICFAGAGEGIFAAMHTLLAPGDHAITVIPGYQSLESIPRSLCATTAVALEATDGWTLDLDRVRAALRPTTRLIVVNFPHNPTGAVLSRATLDGLVAIAREQGAYLFNDEVYRGVERTADGPLPQVVDLYERGLSLGVLSKAYGLPGLRIGWIACRDPDVLTRLESLRHYLTLCSARPSELLATIALRARSRILHRNRKLIERNLALLDDFFSAHADRFEWSRPEGGSTAYVRYLGADGVEAFAQDLVERVSVLVAPSSVFQSALGPTPTDRFRIGFGRDGLEAGLGVLDAYLRDGAAPRRRGGNGKRGAHEKT